MTYSPRMIDKEYIDACEALCEKTIFKSELFDS